MAKKTRRNRLILTAAAFAVYIFAAARPVPRETVLEGRWINSLESNLPVSLGGSETEEGVALPFELGGRFGYLNDQGNFVINRLKKGYVSISENAWAEYGATPESIEIMDSQNQSVITIEDPRGYPLLLDGRVFIVGSEQNSLSALDPEGRVIWSYDFPAPLTCVDAAAGFVLAGTLDGVVELLDSQGRAAMAPFEPGGSRLAVILGCALSSDASRLAVISGVDDQRFLILEHSGGSNRVIYHEFLSDGFRRAVRVAFIDNDARVVFEREGGAGIYDVASRTSVRLPLDGEIAALDSSGGGRLLFVVTSPGQGQKKLTLVRLPGAIIMEAPFAAGDVFLGRRDSKLYIGGNTTVASFELGKR